MQQLTILVDIDHIIADTLPSWLNRIAEKTGVVASVADIVDWDLAKCGPLTNVDPQIIIDILNEPGFTMGVEPLVGASENLKTLSDAGHEIYFVTARTGGVCMTETLTWMQKHFPWVNVETQVWFVHDKYRVVGDVLIDDKPENLRLYRNHHPTAHLIAIDYAYNQQYVPNLIRVSYDDSAWKRIREHIEFLTADDDYSELYDH